MARDWTTATKDALTGQTIRPVLFFEGGFVSGTLNFWTGAGSISWDSKTWTGVGDLIQISPIEENVDIVASGAVISLAGNPPQNISLALSETRQGKHGKVWLGAIGTDGSVVVDPYLAFEGRLDVPEIDDNPDGATIKISYEHRLIALDRPNLRRYSDQDQKIDYPDDKGMEYIPALQDANIKWGGA
jgi:hypothetical protein